MKTKIEILKPVTIASVAAEGPCVKEFRDFVKVFIDGGFKTTTQIPHGALVHTCESHPAWKPWLIEHGFIREVEERERIHVGSLWKDGDYGYIYQLARMGDARLVLISIRGGNRKCDNDINVKDIYNVTDGEWYNIKGVGPLTRLHGHLEFVEDK